MAKSVYNFIPAPKENEVFRPSWANEVSHDIPFEDGESGEIEIKITAQTPIFIKNGHRKNVEENEFSYFKKESGNKEYFIPATSLKGMIRNTLEIFSFSRLNHELVDNNRYSYRDLKIGSQYLRKYDTNNVKAGWLEETNGAWTITECKKLYHIHHKEVDKILGTNFRQFFLTQNPKDKSAKWKYNQINNSNSLNSSFDAVEEEHDKNLVNQGSSFNGTIVLTGQSSGRNEKSGKKPSGKVHEFVFSEETIAIHNIDKEMQKDFRFIYKEDDPNNISPDWKYWKSKLKKGERVPVFFNKNNSGIKHFGLAYMYKLPYEKSIHELSPIQSYLIEKKRLEKQEKFLKPDLATTMFGNIKDEALKGRVYFGHALSKNAIPFSKNEIKEEILAGPKASFYPFYLQNGDYDNAQSKLSGFKKYPIHKSVKSGKYSEKQKENKKVFSKFIPLKKDTVFTAKIRFHNLKKMEIGALLSALTFHNQSNLYSHTLGGAKPFGYGKVKIEVEKLNYLAFDKKEYLAYFEQTMNTELGSKWKDKEAIWKYMAMSSTTVSDERNKQYVYPEMNQKKRINEFTTDAKLPAYNKSEVKITSIADEFTKKKELEILNLFNQLKDSKNIEEIEQNKDKLKDTKFYNSIDSQLIILRKKELEAIFSKAMNSNSIEELQQFLNEYPNSLYKERVKNKIEDLQEKSEFESIKNSTDINVLKSFANTCKNEECKKIIRERITQLQQENKAKKAEESATSALNIEPKTYKEILAKMREFSKLKLQFNTEQKQELLSDIIASFSDENSAKEYKQGYNKKENRLRGAWKEFRKNGLSFEEVTELYNQFHKTKH